jgi:thiosulfate/3-mercaptopyruvate sulfurtransferase
MSVDYPRPEIMVEPSWLAGHLTDPSVRIVDVRAAGQYGSGHIPGAVNLPVARLDDPTHPVRGTLVPPDRFGALMGMLGISRDHRVVLYDQQGYSVAARAFWAFEYFGHPHVAVLQGGLPQWAEEGRPLTGDIPQVTAASYQAEVHPERIATKEDVLKRLDAEGVAILDVRSEAEYTGDMMQSLRGGHIPGAVNVEFTQAMMRSAVPALKPALALRQMYEEVGVTPDKEVVTYCQAGIRASHSYFVLRLMGYDRVRNYSGSWGDWGNDPSLPVET